MKLTLLIATLALAMNTEAAEWERLAPLPEPNGGFIAGVAGEQIVVIGGTNWKEDTKHWLKGIHAYDPKLNSWRETGRLDAPLAYAAVGQDAGTLWFASGSTGTETQRSIWKIDAGFSVTRAWTLDEGIVLAGSALIGPALYVLGGTDDMNHLEHVTNAFRAIDLRDGGTTKLPEYPGPAFMIGASAACGARFFVFGGARWDTAAGDVANFSSAHAFDTATKRWEKLAPFPYAVRGLCAVALDERRILLAGGYKNNAEEFTDAVFVFDTSTGKYTATQPLPYKGMPSLVKLGDWLYCIAGEDRKKHRTDAVFRIQWKELLPR